MLDQGSTNTFIGRGDSLGWWVEVHGSSITQLVEIVLLDDNPEIGTPVARFFVVCVLSGIGAPAATAGRQDRDDKQQDGTSG